MTAKVLCFRILKLHEFGIINALKARWLKSKYAQTKVERFYSPLTIDQVSLLVSIYCVGFFLAIFIFIVENVVWRKAHKTKLLANEKYYD